MKEFHDKYFDLAVVDPQYGINAPNMNMGSNESRKGDGYPGVSTAEKLRKGRLNQGAGKLKNRALNTMDCSWDYERPKPEYFKELFRVSRNQIIFGYNYFLDMLPPSRGFIVWDKCQPWENFSQAELAWTSFDMPAKLIRLSNTGGANTEEKIHPTQKPMELYGWIYSKFAEAGMKILDTHVGSGTNLRAAYDAGLQFVGFEKSAFYYQKSKEKLDLHMAQMNLFAFPEVIPTHDRFGLVTVNGVDYQIVDIGLRMLEPRELYGCQGVPEDYIIDHDCEGNEISRTDQVQKCGNMVCPPIPAALVKANLPELCVAERTPNCQIKEEQSGQLKFA